MNVYLSQNAKKQHHGLPKIQQKKIKKKLELLATDPTSGKKLGGEFAGQRSLKAWPYRILYLIDKKDNAVYVISILHRQGAYK